MKDNVRLYASSDWQAVRATAAGKVVQASSSLHSVSWITHSSPALQKELHRSTWSHGCQFTTVLCITLVAVQCSEDARFMSSQISGFSALTSLRNRQANKKRGCRCGLSLSKSFHHLAHVCHHTLAQVRIITARECFPGRKLATRFGMLVSPHII